MCCISMLLFYSYTQPNSKVCISYPRGKEDKTMTLFFNKENIGKIHYGERLVFTFKKEGNLKITILDNDTYTEQRTLSKNTRTLMLRNGKSYYLELVKGEINYMPDENKGKEHFDDSGKFILQPSQPFLIDPDGFLVP